MPKQEESKSDTPSKETLEWTLGRIDGYIALMDTKCEVLLAAISIGVGAACSNTSCLQSFAQALGQARGKAAFAAATVCVLACLVTFFCMGAVLVPRLDSSERHPSKLFFGDIAGMNPKPTVRAYLGGYEDSRTMEEDLAGEIIACSRICSKKARWYRFSLVALGVTLASFVALMALTL